jgi:hypothetical protein
MTTCSYFYVYVHLVKIQDNDLSVLPGGATAPFVEPVAAAAAAAAAACC